MSGFVTVELVDLLGANVKQVENHTSDVCYNLSGVEPRRRKKKGKSLPSKELSGEGGISEVLRKISLINPGFIQVKEIKDLGKDNFVHRRY